MLLRTRNKDRKFGLEDAPLRMFEGFGPCDNFYGAQLSFRMCMADLGTSGESLMWSLLNAKLRIARPRQ